MEKEDDIEYYMKDFLMTIAPLLLNKVIDLIVIEFGQNQETAFLAL